MADSKKNSIAKIQTALNEIRPFLKSDGGDIEFISFDNKGVVKVRLLGTCINCNVNQMTLKSGVETTVKKHAPEVVQVLEVGQEDQTPA